MTFARRCLLLALMLPTLAAAADFRLPPGFVLREYAAGVEGARQLALTPAGHVVVATLERRVYLLPADAPSQPRVLLDGLDAPRGVAVYGGDLYIGEIPRIRRVRGIDAQLAGGGPAQPEVVLDKLPADRHHGTRVLRFAPDGELVFPVSAPCNVCDAQLPYAALHGWRPDTGARRILARGVRSVVGLDFHPASGQLWFSDNGRDRLGDDLPPDEINVLDRAGAHYGFPWIHGGDIADPGLNRRGAEPADRYAAPAWRLPAHVAPLGVHFYRGDNFPARWRGALLVAEHGSWNRSTKVGYRVSALFLGEDNRTVLGYEPLVEGFLGRDGQVHGRPVDLLGLPDGSLLISDDHGNRIWRLSYEPTP